MVISCRISPMVGLKICRCDCSFIGFEWSSTIGLLWFTVDSLLSWIQLWSRIHGLWQCSITILFLFSIHPRFPYSMFIDGYINHSHPAISSSFYIHSTTNHHNISSTSIYLSLGLLVFRHCYLLFVSRTQHLHYSVQIKSPISLGQ